MLHLLVALQYWLLKKWQELATPELAHAPPVRELPVNPKSVTLNLYAIFKLLPVPKTDLLFIKSLLMLGQIDPRPDRSQGV